MHKTLFTISAAVSFLMQTALAVVPTAHAQTLELPMQFEYAGLTFAEPLAFTSQNTLPRQTLTFSIPEKLAITHEDTKEVLGEVILLPTITMAVTLPVAPTHTLATNKDDQDEPTPAAKVTLVKAAETPTSAPTSVPATPTVQATVVQTATTNAGGLDPEKLFAMSNAYRQARGLPAFQKDERVCSLAASRAPEIAGEIASGAMHSGLRARALPYWNTENIISMRTEEAAFNWWVNDKIHHDAIVGNYTYSCVACSGNSCAQEFTNFQPK